MVPDIFLVFCSKQWLWDERLVVVSKTTRLDTRIRLGMILYKKKNDLVTVCSRCCRGKWTWTDLWPRWFGRVMGKVWKWKYRWELSELTMITYVHKYWQGATREKTVECVFENKLEWEYLIMYGTEMDKLQQSTFSL